MNLNQRIAGYGRKLSKTERLLVDEMLARYPQSLLESATALARRWAPAPRPWCACSPSWATTAMRRRRPTRAEVTARLASPGERADAMGADGHGARACLHNALLHDQHNLQATFSTVDPAVFEAAVRALTQRKARVHVLGLRQAAPLAGYAALYLNLCLPTVRPLATQAVVPGRPVAMGGRTRRAAGLHLPALLGGGGQGAAGVPRARREGGADHRLGFRAGRALGRPGAGGAVLQRLAVRFYTAPMALCNALLAAVAQRCRQPLGEALARGEALWDAQWIRS